MNTDKKIFALGFFDGVHLGHQALLAQCVALATQQGAQSAAITFLQHPLSPFTDDPPKLITTEPERDRLLRQYGIGLIYKFPATAEFMATPWTDFLEELIGFGAVGFVCGDDFRFGKDGAGNAQALQAFCARRNLPCIIVPEQTLDGIRISSSHIRGLLLDGNVTEAARFLGHPYAVSAPVVHGMGFGRTIGIPTANMDIPNDVLTPRRGVYACTVSFDAQSHPAVTNVGCRPTVGGRFVTTEPWILDFDGDLYGKTITVEYHAFLRPEEKFATVDALKAQILLDAAQTRKLLAK